MAFVELGEEVCGLGVVGVLEVSHDVVALLPDLGGLHKFHLTLRGEDRAWVLLLAILGLFI